MHASQHSTPRAVEDPENSFRRAGQLDFALLVPAPVLVPHKVLDLVVVVRPLRGAGDLLLGLTRLLACRRAQDLGCRGDVFRDCFFLFSPLARAIRGRTIGIYVCVL